MERFYLRKIIFCGLLLMIFATLALSQKGKSDEPTECKSDIKTRGKFRTLFVGSSGGESFQIHILVNIKNQTDKNYLAIAEYFKAKYCKEENLYVSVFDSKEHWKLNGIPQPERPIEGYERALYFLHRKTRKEGFEIYKIVNGKIETRVLEIHN